ncbi:MAG: NdvB [Clostridiaceae bacterium]|jgi:cellobiose phosphorylase|nr:NdvB [Clostridiaceae bacterium]
MYYVYIILVAVIGVIIYFAVNRKVCNEHNIMNDIPTLNVNREGLEKHAEKISNEYSATSRTNCRRKVIKSLKDSYDKILKCYLYIDKNTKNKRELVPAEEWLLDNLYLIEREYKDILHSMPGYYYKNLPTINKGIMKNYPRIYHIAVELVSHTDGRVDEDIIESFINAYQESTILTSGELWALPIMIRIALIQNIGKVSEKIVFSEEEKREADLDADALINAVNENNLQREFSTLKVKKTGEISSHYIERFIKVLRDNGIDNAEIYKWIDERLDLQETNSERMIKIEHQLQGSFQLSVGNSITGIREVSSINWKQCFERLSYVEKILRKDPSGIYNNMDFKSRDYYRHGIEKLCRETKIPESFIAKKAIECAEESVAKESNEYLKHVGYYIIDEGKSCLKQKMGYEPRGLEKIKFKINNNAVAWYLGTIIAGILIFVTLTIVNTYAEDVNPIIWKYILAAIVVIIPCSEIVISIFHWSINHLSEPSFLPKLEFAINIPEEFTTVVVVPALLNNEKRVHELLNNMEVYYLANKEKNIYFALLGDFKDSRNEEESEDDKIVQEALGLIKLLNEKYSCGEKNIFYFFNRFRKYNEKEKKWMGWERKRGKLMEFNALIRGDNNTSFNVLSSDISSLKNVKYVITLDADTQLPRDCAKKLIGTMAHVLNKPYVDLKNKKVLRGYGLMQPRISVSTASANKTIFSRIFSGETGIDMYTTAISDVYQDIFGEGIFTGKGIYDVDIFNLILKDEIPENSVLSHDLLEGCYTRSALVTDIELIDGYPSSYLVSCKRLHRWVRGDWQLIPWIFKKSTLNIISKWKIVDNIRRSLFPVSLVVLTLLSFSILPKSERWFAIAIIALLAPMLFDVSEAVVTPIKGISLSGKVDSGKTVVEQIFLIFCFLPYVSYLMLDAIIRTIYRVYVSKRNLLEWQTAADAESQTGKNLKYYINAMWMASALALFTCAVAAARSYEAFLIMLPTVIIWFLSPYIAYYISKDVNKISFQLQNEHRVELRKIARRTWAYFEDFVNDENHWLAPDNYQEDPNNGVAHRTSPTNMAMGLISNIVAYDFGYIGILETVERIEKILDSMEGLKRYRGHFYNWYDTKTKDTLKPEYISTVDSGNLVGYLWEVSVSLEEYLTKPIINKNQICGLEDLLHIADNDIYEALNIRDFYSIIFNVEINHENNIIYWKRLLMNIWSKTEELENIIDINKLYWVNKVKNTVSRYLSEIQKFIPWLDIILETNKINNNERENIINIISNVPAKELSSKIQKAVIDCKGSSINRDDKWYEELCLLVENGTKEINNLVDNTGALINRLNNIADSTDFTILYDKKRQLFSIGYDIGTDSIGNCYYDLLASEARQASFIAIAKGDVEQIHWFKLGRSLTFMFKSNGLVSWSGTMFEYFMPLLIMRSYPNTLLNETYKAVIDGQRKYCRHRRVPWGISESAFYNFDINLNYQYKAFGIPGIGLKRGLSNELVISPYSTILALQIDLLNGMTNINRLISEGLVGKYGFYESVDYTQERLPKGKEKAVIKCFMVHHEGMSFMALDNVLNKNILQDRFHRVPRVKATELLLQEKVPNRIIYDRKQIFDHGNSSFEKNNIIVRKYTTANTEIPETHLLSNGAYSLMITNSGTGYSKLDNTFVYRWKEDVTRDNKGTFFYIRNVNSRDYWSAAFEPCKSTGEKYEVTFALDKAEFLRKDGNIETRTEISVSNEDNCETRRLNITNHSDHSRTIEITSYSEVTLATYSADIVHPAFSNLFISTEFIESLNCIAANRRVRKKGEKQPWVMETICIDGEKFGPIQYETNRANFIGRCNNLTSPQVMEKDSVLRNTVGAVLDPIISMRVRVKIPPAGTVKVAYTMGIGNSRDEVLNLAKKYNDMHNVDRIFELSWTQAQLEMKYLGIKSSQANMYQLMASNILFLNTTFKDREKYIKSISKSQSDLWPYGISGDLPIVLLIISKESHIDMVRQMLNAHEYWSTKGLKVDLVIVNLEESDYNQTLQNSVRDFVASSHARDKQNKPGGIFLHNRSTMSEEDIKFIAAIARLVINSDKGSLISQIKTSNKVLEEVKELPVSDIDHNYFPYRLKTPELEYFNEYGGFDLKNNEYTIILNNYKNTPAPWINVISNGKFGFNISENGVSYSWYKNSRENKITNWSNDPVEDGESEEIYLRNEDNGKVWSISPKPVRNNGEYIITHGFGYSVFTHEFEGIIGEATMFAAKENSVKLCIVKLKNNTKTLRKISITYYARMVLGVNPEQTAQYISTYYNGEEQYIYANNPYNKYFNKLYAYLKIIGGEDISYTGNRKEFFGRGGSVEFPKALKRIGLSNTVGSGYDPCISMSCKVNLEPLEEKYVTIILGEDENIESINEVVHKFSDLRAVNDELLIVKKSWKDLLGKIRVKTPDKTMDILLNGWLMYQVISCRLWAKTAFYQCGGAVGFRDQLQDSMAALYLNPEICRSQIIYSASRQYVDGDVQHWWHPIINSGIRTRFSDDLLWMPFVTADYIKNTGDYSILDEKQPYLKDKPLEEGEDERYNIISDTEGADTIYNHCIKAIDRSLKFGSHGLPLMGSGDWNDGMSTVGNGGKGESVWLGWFLYSILNRFTELCKFKNDGERAVKYFETKELLKENLEKYAWDGDWYRRAYFDDGTPLGSAENEECKIDSLAQSWSVISGAGKPSRIKEAMESLETNLVKYDKGMVLLLTPPFYNSSSEPGYIKGYVPGVRENGGQYTHGAVWVIVAYCKMGLGDKAWRIFNMINPINHSRSHLECEVYKTEPYVMTADIYDKEPHEGRGGWSWYTGAAGWMYRAGIEEVLGLKFEGGKGFRISPCIPNEWKEYSITYEHNGSVYNIEIMRGDNKGVYLNGERQSSGFIEYQNKGTYKINVII